jgi:glyoxylase-like metal-dependent hydrolase (beta-lactamase superfamily II)
MTILRTIKRQSPLAGFAIASIVLMWTGLSAQSAEQQIVADASMALGGRERILAVKTLIVEGGGRDLNVGQSLRFDDLGLQSDVWQIREYKRAYDLTNTRARFEAIREAQYPFYQGEAAPRLIQSLDGEVAFNVNAEGNATRIFGPQAAGRLAEYLRHPLTLVRAALQPAARLSNARTQGSERLVDVTIGGATFTLAIDATTKLPTRVVQMIDSATLGDTPVETRFAGYEAVSGLQLPTRLTTRTDRWLSAEVRIMRQSVDGTVGDLAAPPNVRTATQPAAPVPPTTTSREIAKGVWFVEGTTHKSLLAEFSDHMLLIEAPNNERVRAVLAKARELRPNKPVTKLLVTHHHGDHTSGVRLAVAEGVTEIITHRSNVAYLNLVLSRPHTINPDDLSKTANARLPKITPIDDEGVLRDSTMTINLYHIRDNTHADSMLMVYFPNGKVLTQPDIYMPNDKRNIIDSEPYGHAPWLQNFMANIVLRKLDVAWHAPIHGDYVPHSQFLDALVFMTQFVPPRSSTN